MKKYTFREYIAAVEGADFDVLEEEELKSADDFLNSFSDVFKSVHRGDCTSESMPCGLCVLEILLSDYRKYFFDE